MSSRGPMSPGSNGAHAERAYAAGRAAYPTLTLASEVFARAWERLAAARHARSKARGLPPGEPVSAPDLYLATACDAGDSAAWEVLDRAYTPQLRGLLRKHGATEAEAAEMLADLPGLLCEPPPLAQARTRIGTYDGSGLLVSWLSIFVLRTVNARRKQRTGESLGAQDPAAEAGSTRAGALPGVLVSEALQRFQAAVAGAWETLTDRERLGILLKYRDNLSGRETARVLGVGEPRVSRLLAAGLEKIRAAVARGMPGTPPGSHTPDRALWMALTQGVQHLLTTMPSPPHDLREDAHA